MTLCPCGGCCFMRTTPGHHGLCVFLPDITVWFAMSAKRKMVVSLLSDDEDGDDEYEDHHQSISDLLRRHAHTGILAIPARSSAVDEARLLSLFATLARVHKPHVQRVIREQSKECKRWFERLWTDGTAAISSEPLYSAPCLPEFLAVSCALERRGDHMLTLINPTINKIETYDVLCTQRELYPQDTYPHVGIRPRTQDSTIGDMLYNSLTACGYHRLACYNHSTGLIFDAMSVVALDSCGLDVPTLVTYSDRFLREAERDFYHSLARYFNQAYLAAQLPSIPVTRRDMVQGTTMSSGFRFIALFPDSNGVLTMRLASWTGPIDMKIFRQSYTCDEERVSFYLHESWERIYSTFAILVELMWVLHIDKMCLNLDVLGVVEEYVADHDTLETLSGPLHRVLRSPTHSSSSSCSKRQKMAGGMSMPWLRACAVDRIIDQVLSE